LPPNPISQDLEAPGRFREADRATQMTEIGAKQPLVAHVFDISFLRRVVSMLARRRSADHRLRLGSSRSAMNEVPVPSPLI
jgi:hypothetical protein